VRLILHVSGSSITSASDRFSLRVCVASTALPLATAVAMSLAMLVVYKVSEPSVKED
jgi:hypothetical protein